MRHLDHFYALPEDVIAFAWSAPMRELATRIGISDVGLRQLLRSQGIPTPPQGHWNRVHAGRTVSPPPASRPRGPGESGRVRLDGRFRDHVPSADPMPVDGPFASERVPEDLGELKSRELERIGTVTVPRTLARPHHGLSGVMRREEKRRQKFAESGWDWDRPKHDHPLAQRQLRLADAILRALAKRDHDGVLQESDSGFELLATVGDTGVTLVIDRLAVRKEAPMRITEREVRELPASTPLGITLKRTWKRDALGAWADDGARTLERQIAEVTASVIVAGEAAFRRSLHEAVEEEQRWARWREESRRRELARLNERRLEDLRTSGELLREAQTIRALVARVEAAMHDRASPGVSEDKVARWKQWALTRADELDPVLSGQVFSHLDEPAIDDQD